MSIAFNDTSTFRGLVQMYEKEIGANQGDVSGSTADLKAYTADANNALDDFIYMAITSSGSWQFDDTSTYESDGVTLRGYPIIYRNIVSGTRDYFFTTDGGSNLILDIFKVLIKTSATATLYQEISPIDQQTQSSDIDQETAATGVPQDYDKTGNGVFFGVIPNYSATNGIKVLVNREGSYFISTDTTKKAGIPGLFHSYLYLKPAMHYARRKSLPALNGLREQVQFLERDIKDYFGQRERDVRSAVTMEAINFV